MITRLTWPEAFSSTRKSLAPEEDDADRLVEAGAQTVVTWRFGSSISSGMVSASMGLARDVTTAATPNAMATVVVHCPQRRTPGACARRLRLAPRALFPLMCI